MRPGRMHGSDAMAVPLSFLHSPVTPVWRLVGQIISTGANRTCSPDYTPQDRPVGLSGVVNDLTGESDHDLLPCHH